VRKGKAERAKIGATIFTMVAKAILCALPLVPAVTINLDSAGNQGLPWTVFAIGSVLAGAVFVEISLHGRSLVRSLLFGLLAAFFVTLNCLNAIGNAATASDHLSDDRRSQIERKQRLATMRGQWSQARKAQFEVAGDTTPEAFEAEIQSKKAADAKRWISTESCDPLKITAGPSREFCAAIAELERKKAAAVKRDDLDQHLADLDTKDAVAAPSTVDSYADNIGRLVTAFGYTIGEREKALIASSRDWLKGIGVELLAAFGPAALLFLLMGVVEIDNAAHRPERKIPGRQKPDSAREGLSGETPPVDSPKGATGDDPQIDGFVARRLEGAPDEYVSATPLFNAWVADCLEQGIEPGSQKAFSQRIRQRVAYDKNSGRPRYCHVRIREKGAPRLKIVTAS
jgi:hypothetical protein